MQSREGANVAVVSDEKDARKLKVLLLTLSVAKESHSAIDVRLSAFPRHYSVK